MPNWRISALAINGVRHCEPTASLPHILDMHVHHCAEFVNRELAELVGGTNSK
jgi:hypothetical protein